MLDVETKDAPLHPGREALAHIAEVLSAKPRKDDHALSRATVSLSKFRAELIALQRGDACTIRDRERLSHLNAIISVVMGMHFPIDAPPWEEFARAETWLRALVEETDG
jgi:hypothetical protein